jgi:hypothetical protein
MNNSDFVEYVLQLLMANEKNQELYCILNEKLQACGIVEFIEQVAQPLTTAVGEKWLSGSMDIFIEHFYTQTINEVLNNWVAYYLNNESNINGPRVLLTTLSGEKHGLGLAMVQAILCTQKVFCMNLGTELPISEFDKVIRHYKINIIGLSFSSFFPKRIIPAGINQLRSVLPPEIELWIGGEGVKGVQELPNEVKILFSPQDILSALRVSADLSTVIRTKS